MKYLPCIIGIWLIGIVIVLIFFQGALGNEEDEQC